MPGPKHSVTTRQASSWHWLHPLGLVFWISLAPNGPILSASANEIGVRHAIFGEVEPNRDGASANAEGEALHATVDISVRVLDYSRDYRFYGVVDGKFSDFDLGEGAAAQEIWADPACHQNRGPPTIWVLAIDGRITQGKTSSEIAARPRHIGEWLPADEIVMQRDRQAGLNNPNQSLFMLARTSQSHLSVKLILRSESCQR
jgi:hypothetical protein